MVLPVFDLTYTPNKRLIHKKLFINDDFVSDLRFAFQFLKPNYNYKLENFIPIDNVDQYTKKRRLHRFIDKFKFIDGKLTFTNEAEEVGDLVNLQETDALTSYEIFVNNSEIFAAVDSLPGYPKELTRIGFGTNDMLNLPNKALAGYMDDRITSLAVEQVFKKHLKKHKFTGSEKELNQLKDLISKTNIDIYNILTLGLYDLDNNNKYDTLLDNLTQINKNIYGMENVFINSKNFKYSFKNTLIQRSVLTDDEVSKLLENKFRVSSGLYKIRNAYWRFEEAFRLIKNNFRKDVFIYRYVYEVKENPGFYVEY